MERTDSLNYYLIGGNNTYVVDILRVAPGPLDSPAERRHGARTAGRDDVAGGVVVDHAGEVRELALPPHEDVVLPDARRRRLAAGLHLVDADDRVRPPAAHAGQRAPQPPRRRPRVRRAQRQRQRAHGQERGRRRAELARRRQRGGDRAVQAEVARHRLIA